MTSVTAATSIATLFLLICQCSDRLRPILRKVIRHWRDPPRGMVVIHDRRSGVERRQRSVPVAHERRSGIDRRAQLPIAA